MGGEKVGLLDEAKCTKKELDDRIVKAREIALSNTSRLPSVAFVEWPDPVYVGGHWTPQLISMAGGDHPLNRAPAIDDGAAKSFPVCIQQIIDSNPDWIIIAPCGLNLESATREAK